ncbi:hypothetical protein MPTK1_2g06090 [Marchantia polymorpha subsp. ruderalis]|uniref:RING-type E3 ubiquitin transferase n=1 Tax=Marchantia polymorpha TaxID=3197 RepID=A0A2R6XDL9_MARPO|nr:hypothetical protein MARPO_0021s0064 [Marchantia polymorpha]BBN01275.1 hypothetical protein Mp_2g06090 [Marchantia polymorpha subsp. ruderalis]|eukprot:PTQ44200.1 hypothetical protein MARPO_0021s0064 [Marchantia polymorpha]
MVLLMRLQSIQVPSFFLCPISLDLMKDPVTLCTGMTYDRSSIEKWLDEGNLTCPATNQLLGSTVVTPNHTLRRLIQDWCVLNQSNGVERIPTPKLPARLEDVKAMVEDLKYGINVHETVKRLRGLARESDKNKRLVVESGAVQELVSLIVLPANDCQSPKREWVEFKEDILATIVLISSADVTRASYNASSKQMACLCWFLKNGQIEAKVNAAVVLESIASSSDLKGSIADLEGVIETMVQLLREKFYPKAVKASLRCLLTLCATRRNRIRLVEAGGVAALVEFLPGAETRGTLERALRILELLASCAEGREAISDHALAIPVLLKLVLRASGASIEHAVVVLYMLSEYSVNASDVRKSIVQVGGFPRLLLLLQTECTLRTKGKAIKLLKQLRPIWNECPCSSGGRALSTVGSI